MEHINEMQIPVCKVFANNGFQIEYMPDFLHDKEFDNYSPHIHSFYEILWFQEILSPRQAQDKFSSSQVCGKHTVDFMEYDVKPNTIFFMAPGQIHYFDHTTYKGVSIKICSDFLQQDELQVPAANIKSHGNSCSHLFLKYDVFHSFDSTPCFLIDDATAAELRKLVSQMEKESTLYGTFGNAEMLQSLMRMFLILVYRNGIKAGKAQFNEVKPSHQLFIRFRSLVEKEYQHSHSIRDYAKRLNTNVRTLNSSINECSGMSPLAFINARIILEAKRLVRYSDMRIKEIAFALGYDDPSYFVRMFKRRTGYMPTEFREADNIIH